MLPVFRVDAGSNRRNQHSSSATGLCSTPRDDDELTFFDPFVVVEELHAKAPFYNQEHLVFVLVMVEDELAFDLVELDVLTVEFGGDVGLPVFRDLGEFFGDVDFGHDGFSRSDGYWSTDLLDGSRIEMVAENCGDNRQQAGGGARPT